MKSLMKPDCLYTRTRPYANLSRRKSENVLTYHVTERSIVFLSLLHSVISVLPLIFTRESQHILKSISLFERHFHQEYILTKHYFL